MTSTTDHPDDQNLLDALRSGSASAFAAIYTRHAPAARKTAGRIVGLDAEDVTQEVFTALWQRPDQVDLARGALRTFTHVLTHRRAVDLLRRQESRRRREVRASQERAIVTGWLEQRDIADVVAGDHVWKQSCQSLNAGLRQIPPGQRTVLELVYYQGLTHSQVASVLGIPLGTVKTRVRQGLIGLRRILGGQDQARVSRAS